MTLPQRINVREERGKPKLRSPAHKAWVRLHGCVVPGCQGRPIEAMHIRRAASTGVGFKPSDAFTASGCSTHHRECHTIGEKSFERRYGIDLMALAQEFYRKSPHRNKLDDPYA